MFVLPCDDVMSQTVGPYQTLPCVDALILDAQPPELPHPHLNPQMTSIVAQVNNNSKERGRKTECEVSRSTQRDPGIGMLVRVAPEY